MLTFHVTSNVNICCSGDEGNLYQFIPNEVKTRRDIEIYRAPTIQKPISRLVRTNPYALFVPNHYNNQITYNRIIMILIIRMARKLMSQSKS